MADRILNLGIVAHVDAGKTSLTERLLYNSGVIDHIGSVDRGDTQADSMDLERKRGITIRSAVVVFTVDGLQINVIDTPGHSDFVAEVERAMRVLDSAILVVSAVEGIQARTRVLMRSLTRLRVPVLIFVNKIDRMGARYEDLLADIRRALSPNCIPMCAVTDLGTSGAQVKQFSFADADFHESLAEVFGETNEAFLETYLDDNNVISADDYESELARQTAAAWVYPVYFGSAITGEGITELVNGMQRLLPAAVVDDEAGLRGTVFKIERGRAGEKVAFLRLHSGHLARGDKVQIFRREADGGIVELAGRVSAVRVFTDGTVVTEGIATSGAICQVGGLTDTQIGDQLGTADGLPSEGVFAPPTLEIVVTPIDPTQRPALHAALTRIAEQDPMIDVRTDPNTSAISIRLFGEVQREVISATLSETYNLAVRFEETRTIYIERLVGSGSALEEISTDETNFFWATVGLRLEPAPPGAGSSFTLDVELGSLPLSFHKAIEESVHQTLQHGLYGWEVLDCAVTLTRTGYASPISAAGDFRLATPLVVSDALKQAGTRVYEPVHRFELQAPVESLPAVLVALNSSRATVSEHGLHADLSVLTGTIPASAVHEISQKLPKLTRGEGLFVTEFESYEPYPGTPPVRTRHGVDPYNREQYMLHALGRIG